MKLLTAVVLGCVLGILGGVVGAVAVHRVTRPVDSPVQTRPLVQTEALQAMLEPGDTLIYTVTVTAPQTVMVLSRITPSVRKRWHLR